MRNSTDSASSTGPDFIVLRLKANSARRRVGEIGVLTHFPNPPSRLAEAVLELAILPALRRGAA